MASGADPTERAGPGRSVLSIQKWIGSAYVPQACWATPSASSPIGNVAFRRVANAATVLLVLADVDRDHDEALVLVAAT